MRKVNFCLSMAFALILGACGEGSDDGSSSPSDSPSPMPSATSETPPTGCKDPSRNCLGVLAPGTYSSKWLDVFGTGKGGQLTYTVGPGWANTLDHSPSYWIRPEAAYLAQDWDLTTSGIYVWTNVAAAVQNMSCPEESDPNVKTDAASLAKWMRGLPGLTFTNRPSTTVDGHRAIVMDVRVSGDKALCGSDDPLLASRPGAADPWVNGINISEAQRIILLDLPGGHTAEVVVAGPKAEIKALVALAEPVIASLEFTR